MYNKLPFCTNPSGKGRERRSVWDWMKDWIYYECFQLILIQVRYEIISFWFL